MLCIITKFQLGEESAQNRKMLEDKMTAIGYQIVTDRGDIKKGSILL